jgi:hypothetical protein
MLFADPENFPIKPSEKGKSFLKLSFKESLSPRISARKVKKIKLRGQDSQKMSLGTLAIGDILGSSILERPKIELFSTISVVFSFPFLIRSRLLSLQLWKFMNYSRVL